MAVTQKNRRKIDVNGRLFLWSLHDEDVNQLHIVSDDKRLNLRSPGELETSDGT